MGNGPLSHIEMEWGLSFCLVFEILVATIKVRDSGERPVGREGNYAVMHPGLL